MATGKLRQVEEDAMRIQARRFRDQEEDRQYEDLKNKPTEDDAKTPEEVLAEVQKQNSETAVKAAVELVSAENVKRAKESTEEAEDEEEVSEPKPEADEEATDEESTEVLPEDDPRAKLVDLKARATELGVEDAESFTRKADVVDAINEKKENK